MPCVCVCVCVCVASNTEPPLTFFKSSSVHPGSVAAKFKEAFEAARDSNVAIKKSSSGDAAAAAPTPAAAESSEPAPAAAEEEKKKDGAVDSVAATLGELAVGDKKEAAEEKKEATEEEKKDS
jgi:hypothetical protein